MDLSLIPYALNLAAIYSLMAISISMIWSSIGMLNLAHGATFAVSGYAAWQFSIIFKPIILAFFGKTLLANLLMGLVLISSAMVAGAIFGILIYFLAYLRSNDDPVPENKNDRFAYALSQKAVLELTHNWGTENNENFKHHDGNSDPRGFGHIGITVPDVYEACSRFEKKGVEFQKKPDDGNMKGLAFIKDPDGYWIEILSAKGLSSTI